MPTTTRQGYVAGQQITKRLDVLGNLHSGCFGVSWWFVRVHLIAGGAWAMATMQTMSFAYMALSLNKEFPMTDTEKAFLLIGSSMLGAFAGAFVFGYFADTHGRKFALLVSFVITHAAGTLCAVSSSTLGLTLFRFVVGIGLGGQQPILATLIMELAPTSLRGRALVYLDAFWPLGAMFGMLLCREVEPSMGWRAVCALSACTFAYIPLLYYCVPESPKWLATTGKIDEAVRVLRTIEQASSVFHGEDADDAIKIDLQLGGLVDDESKRMILQAHQPSFFELMGNRFRILMRFPYLSRTLMLWFVWTVMTMSNSAMCVYLDESFIRQVSSRSDKALLVYSVLVAQLLGNLSACALIDRTGRRYTIICFVLLSSGGSLLEVYLERTMLSMVLSGFCRNFAYMAAWGCLFAYTPELYPTSIRVIGIGYAWGMSRLGYFAGPYVIIWMRDHLQMGDIGVTWVLFGLSVFVALAIFFFGIETANRDAEARGSSMVTTRETSGIVISYQKHDNDDELPIMGNTGNTPIHII